MKKILSIISFAFLFFNLSQSQNQIKLDSLTNIITTTKQDTTKIKACLEAGKEYEKFAPDTALTYYKKALKITKAKAEKERQQAQRNISIITFALILILTSFILFSYYLKKKHNKLIAEQKQKIAEKNKKLNQLVEEVTTQRNEIEKQKSKIEEKNKDITDSIKYAYRIQNAILPPDYLVKRLIPDSFILYKPKDVVSGDFYFVSEFHDKIVFSAVDCTGHGVPGALMSVVGYNWLVQGVREPKINTPGKLLSFLDEGVNDTLRQTADESGVKDSMDLAVCTIDYKTNTIMYAGAYNPCYYIHNGELIEIKADKLPIGVNVDGVVDIYTDHTIKLDKGDTIYIFSDGYADQFGGPKNKKFKYRQLKEKIMKIQHLPMNEQKDFLNKTLTDWQGNEEQIDDILVIGVRI